MQKGGDFTKISKSGVYFSYEHGQKLGLNKMSFVLFAKTGEDLFVANKPLGLFGGHKVSSNKLAGKRQKGKGDRYWVAIPQKKLRFPLGQYDIGKAVRTSLPDHKGKEVRFEAFKLIPL